jgi:hypothetical protein
MPSQPDDDTGALERARERLYEPKLEEHQRAPLATAEERSLPHRWKETILPPTLIGGQRHVRLAGVFFACALAFFVVALSAAAYIFYVGGNSVSVDKIIVDVQGPTSIAGGDTVPLSLTITNRNAVAIKNATVEVAFPSGTRSATNVTQAYPRYTEDLGTLESGQTVTRSIDAVLFGGAGQKLTSPVSVSYSAAGSNAVFVKKSSYTVEITTTPLSVTVEALSEAVSGQSFPLALTVTSNASVPLSNVVLAGAFPFGFTVTSSSEPLTNSSFLIGTLAPGASKKIVVTGTLTGQESDQRVFRFALGTAATAREQQLAVTYTTLDVPVIITAPFINTTLAINGDTSANVTLTPGTSQNVTLTYTNTLSTSVTNATVSVTVSGTALDYNSIKSSNGFYRSSDRTIVFSRDTDPSLAQLAPGATGIGSFTFATLPLGAPSSSPTITFSIGVAGTRVGQSNVPQEVAASMTKTAKVATNVVLTAGSFHSVATLISTGPVIPTVGYPTTYAIQWNVRNDGSAVAGATVTAVLPSYVTYTTKSAGAGTFSYDEGSRTVTWQMGDLAQGGNVTGAFQVALTPSTSQRGNSPVLVGRATFSGFDRFAGVAINASTDAVTTETRGDPGYNSTWAIVQ